LLADEVYQVNSYSKPWVSFKKALRDMGPRYNDFEMLSFHSVSKGVIGEYVHLLVMVYTKAPLHSSFLFLDVDTGEVTWRLLALTKMLRPKFIRLLPSLFAPILLVKLWYGATPYMTKYRATS